MIKTNRNEIIQRMKRDGSISETVITYEQDIEQSIEG
jgi:hypothetical protein